MSKNLTLNFLAELIGTTIFIGLIITVINNTESTLNFLKIGLTLSVVIVFFGGISGGAFNPAVSLMLYFNNKITIERMAVQIIAQILGAMLSLLIYKYLTSKGDNIIKLH